MHPLECKSEKGTGGNASFEFSGSRPPMDTIRRVNQKAKGLNKILNLRRFSRSSDELKLAREKGCT